MIVYPKYSGCGNSFYLVDNRNLSFPTGDKEKISRLCAHDTDGVVLLENSSKAHIRMRIFNRDGKETEMCGNGARCLIRFLEHQGDPRREFRIETMERTLTAHNHGELIAVQMGDPVDIHWNEPIEVDGKRFFVHHLNTGVPHAVTFVNFIQDIDVESLGSKIRHHPKFSPRGVNANFAQIEANEMVTLRTYERGVEAETLACGTGACATALAVSKIYGISSPIAVLTQSKEILYISFTRQGDHFSEVTLTGPANLV